VNQPCIRAPERSGVAAEFGLKLPESGDEVLGKESSRVAVPEEITPESQIAAPATRSPLTCVGACKNEGIRQIAFGTSDSCASRVAAPSPAAPHAA
jgi:hypothetical protein